MTVCFAASPGTRTWALGAWGKANDTKESKCFGDQYTGELFSELAASSFVATVWTALRKASLEMLWPWCGGNGSAASVVHATFL